MVTVSSVLLKSIRVTPAVASKRCVLENGYWVMRSARFSVMVSCSCWTMVAGSGPLSVCMTPSVTEVKPEM